MMKIIKKLTSESKIIPIALGISIGILGLPYFLEDYFPAVGEFINENPIVIKLSFVPLVLTFGLLILLLIFSGIIDLLEHYHNLRNKGESIDRAFFKLVKILIVVSILAILIFKFS